MKKGLFSFLVICTLNLGAQNKESFPLQNLILDGNTTVSKGDGKVITKNIGKEGGRIVSEDGKMELVFPEGALSENISISIQAIPNISDNGTANSYQLEPSGTQFKKPVELIYSYTDEEAKTCPPVLMGLAMQDHNGKWSYINYEDWDSAGKKLRGSIEHFSSVSNAFMIRLRPKKNLVYVQGSVLIEVKEEYKKYNMSIDAVFRPTSKQKWFVNWQPNGNKRIGYLTIGNEVNMVDNNMSTHATYHAPDYILNDESGVEITMQLEFSSGKYAGMVMEFKCIIHVVDAYQLTVVHTSKMPIAADNEITDKAEFIVFIFSKRLQIKILSNYPPELTKSVKRNQCELKIITAGAQGYLHLDENYQGLELSSHYPPEVLFSFLHKYEQLLYFFQWICPKMNIISPPSPMYGDPIAPEINFIANGQKQIINFTVPNVAEYKLIVEPYRE